ncbi:methyl-accepting chemotaxis protein [Niallia sp. 01092]|uniref:methyl-accepting chemotaxis protein n=1 Tax=unclassified Niallia TaxID=2837522 RepID=UPI003FD2289C
MKILKNITITKKLLVIISVSALALSIVGLVGLNYIKEMAKDSERMYKENLLPISQLMQFRLNTRANDAYTLELMLTKDSTRNDELFKEIDTNLNENKTIVNTLQNSMLESKEVQLMQDFVEKEKLLEASRGKVLKLAMANQNEEAYSLYSEELETNRLAVTNILREIQKTYISTAERINQENQDGLKQATTIVWVVIIAALLLLLSLGFLIAKMIITPIREIKSLLGKAENGDFTVKGSYQSKDEVGELMTSFNHMTAQLQSTLATVSDSSQQVAAASEELSASAEESSKASEHITLTIQELAYGSDKQVQTVENSSRAITDITHYTKTIEKNTQKMTQGAHHASQMSLEGNQAIDEVSKQMNSINANVNRLSETVKSLDERSSEIGKITDVITTISSQTNLLALNAAIEAARAGEHGKGFAIVADEVRKLAEESSKSTEQISKLIQLIQTDTENTLQSMKNTSEEVHTGLKVVDVAGSSFQKIEIAIKDVVAQIGEISETLKELARGTEHVNSSILVVNEVAEASASSTQNVSAATQEQLAAMEEIAASSQSLALLAEDLQMMLAKFKI